MIQGNNAALLGANMVIDPSGWSEQFRDGQKLRQEYEARQQQKALNEIMKVGDHNGRLELAQQHKYAGALVPLIQQQEQDRLMAVQKYNQGEADIANTNAQAAERNATASDKTYGVSEKQGAAVATASNAANGDITAFRQLLGGMVSTGRLPARVAQDLNNGFESMTPEVQQNMLKAYGASDADIAKVFKPEYKEVDAGGSVYGYNVNPITGDASGAQWIVDKTGTPDNILDNETLTNNNIRTNATSRQNNIETNQTSRANNIETNQTNYAKAELAAEMQKYGIDTNAANAQQQLEFKRQEAEVKNNQAEFKTFGDKVYVVYKSGTNKGMARPALDANGKQITNIKQNPAISKSAHEETKRLNKMDMILPEIKKLLPNATGSKMGSLIDAAAGSVGYTTDGAATTSQLQTLAGQLVALMPRMEGPQSNIDVEMYKEMAGNLSDPTKTVKQRQAALQTIEMLNNKYRAASKSAGNSNASSKSSLDISDLLDTSR